MQRKFLMLMLLSAALMLTIAAVPAGAQAGNLLLDGGMEGEYTNRGRADLNVPANWSLWYTESPRTADWQNLVPVGFPHLGPGPNPQEGARAQNFNRGYATFTVALYQTVPVAAGTNLIGSAWAQVKTCNVAPNADNCGSAAESGAYVRVGIDPNGGNNPYDSDIVWSPNSQPHDQWLQMTTNATATGTSATLFIFGTQAFPSQLNNLYIDNAYLGTGGPGGAAAGAAPPATPTPAFVPFVTAQNARPDGSIIHVVNSGDTLDSIAVAYGMTRADILALNPDIVDARFIQIGQEIIIRLPAPTGAGSGEIPGSIGAGDSETTPPDGEAGGGVVFEATTGTRPRSFAQLGRGGARRGVIGGSAGESTFRGVPLPEFNLNPNLDTGSTGSIPGGANLAASGEVESVSMREATKWFLDASVKVVDSDFVGAMRGIALDGGLSLQLKKSRYKQEATPEPQPELREPVQSANAAPAPVRSIQQGVLPAFDPASVTSAQVCVNLFEDSNGNRIYELGESLLVDGVVTLLDSAGAQVAEPYTTSGSEPFCFENLPAGDYLAVAQAPAGYGLTTPAQFEIEAVIGVPVIVAFGAAQGVEAVIPPPADDENAAIMTNDESSSSVPIRANPVRDNLGLIVVGFAGVILIFGIGVSVFLSRR